ncbi:HPr kinase/phosphorylase [Phenylobacterium sp.]|uniref:HPr kinase/phosphorylase n=1 Tax=Phenylobacterium sp. TaxID=1871053 RepID=UPI0035AE7EAC
MILHAGLVALRLGGRWKGALIEGPSGCGKSDLALRALEAGFRLVADDRVVAWTCDGALFGRAPANLHGLIEVRGLDVGRVPALGFCQVALVVRCGPAERLPDPETCEHLGVRLPRVAIQPLEASAPAKMRRALEWLGHGGEGAYQTGFATLSSSRPGGDSR